MDQVIGIDLDPYCFAYPNDIIILGETFEQHLELLREVFRRLRAAKLKINPEKCQFGRKTLRYLGHLVTGEGIRTDPENVNSILKISSPNTVRQLRQFLGMVSWYRRFIEDFSTIAAPLRQLLMKSQKWV